MKKAYACVLSCFCLLAFSLSTVSAEGAEPASVQTRVKRVALFKNGLSYFVREGTLPDEAQVVILGPFAAPSHGTFWVSCPESAKLNSVTSREVTLEEDVPARSLIELLRANIGREAVLGNPWDGGGLLGTIVAMTPPRPRAARQPNRYQMGPSAGQDSLHEGGGSPLLFFKTHLGVSIFDATTYGRVQFTSPDFSTTLTREIKRVEVRADLAAAQRGDWLSVSYLAKGITWAPSYLLDISHPKDARLTAKALIVNEAEDLEEAHVDLITGFPNLQFADVLSPMAKKEDLAAFLRSLSRGRSEMGAAAVMANVMVQSGEFTRGGRGGGGASSAMPDYGAAAVGRIAEDLFLYPLEDVTLAKDETGYYPLFTENVPYTEFYHWEIRDYINEQDRYGVRRQQEGDKPEEVWHSIRLTNTTAVPWTTAPAQLMNDGNIIGQDTLKYTPPEGESTVKITQAVSVNAEQTEVEVERTREAERIYGDYFDRVSLEGSLNITNYKAEKISLEIEKTLSGEVKHTSHKAEDITLARGLRRMNPVHELTWKIELQPGESQEITYTYEALIRR